MNAGLLERLVLEIEIHIQLDQNLISQLSADPALGADRVVGHQEADPEKVLGRDRGAAAGRVDLFEHPRHASPGMSLRAKVVERQTFPSLPPCTAPQEAIHVLPGFLLCAPSCSDQCPQSLSHPSAH